MDSATDKEADEKNRCLQTGKKQTKGRCCRRGKKRMKKADAAGS